MTELEKKLIKYANSVIDDKCDWEGPTRVLPELVEFGFTKEELIEMRFDEDEIDEAIQNAKEEEDEEEDEEYED